MHAFTSSVIQTFAVRNKIQSILGYYTEETTSSSLNDNEKAEHICNMY